VHFYDVAIILAAWVNENWGKTLKKLAVYAHRQTWEIFCHLNYDKMCCSKTKSSQRCFCAKGERPMSVTSIELTGHADPRSDFLDLVRARLRVAGALSAIMVIGYFGFMSFFAFNKPVLATMVAPYASLAMLLGPALILTPVVLCTIYVIWTNRVFDPAVRRLQR
jgi:uncharacterized membrane protein (DUF485 family)